VLHLGASERSGRADDLVDGLSVRAAELGEPTLVAAVAEIRRRGEATVLPVGMHRLADVISSGPESVPPEARQPINNLVAAVQCVRRYPCVLLDAADPAAVARMLAALVADGHRMLVAGTDAEELATVRAALPAEAGSLCLDGESPLTATEQRELRALLVTSTPDRRARLGQFLPEPDQVPDAELVARLCEAAGHSRYAPKDGAELIPELLGELSPDRLAALVETAQQCDAAVSALNQDGQQLWVWELLGGLLFGRSWHIFQRVLSACTDAVAAAETLRDAGDQIAIVGAVSPEEIDHLRRYADFLDAGGRSRSYFRSAPQRAVEPALRHLRLGDASLKDSTALRQALALIELNEAIERIGADCRQLGIPAPPDIPAVKALKGRLDLVRAAVCAVEALRREVLFIHPSSPVSMPDMQTTEAVVRAILSSRNASEMTAARRQLVELAEKLASALPEPRNTDWQVTESADGVPPPIVAPECHHVLRALRDIELADYLYGLYALAGARRELADEQRMAQLLERLRSAAPGVAEAWRRTEGLTFAPGTIRFQPVHELLAALPAADVADVVLLLGADRLDPAYLVVTAAAPRVVVAGAGSSAVAGEWVAPSSPSGSNPQLGGKDDTVVTVLRRAAVPVVLTKAAETTTETNTSPEVDSAPLPASVHEPVVDFSSAHQSEYRDKPVIPTQAGPPVIPTKEKEPAA